MTIGRSIALGAPILGLGLSGAASADDLTSLIDLSSTESSINFSIQSESIYGFPSGSCTDVCVSNGAQGVFNMDLYVYGEEVETNGQPTYSPKSLGNGFYEEDFDIQASYIDPGHIDITNGVHNLISSSSISSFKVFADPTSGAASIEFELDPGSVTSTYATPSPSQTYFLTISGTATSPIMTTGGNINQFKGFTIDFGGALALTSLTSAVPEPATSILWLCGSGLLGMAWFARRRSNANDAI